MSLIEVWEKLPLVQIRKLSKRQMRGQERERPAEPNMSCTFRSEQFGVLVVAEAGPRCRRNPVGMSKRLPMRSYTHSHRAQLASGRESYSASSVQIWREDDSLIPTRWCPEVSR